MSYDHGPLVPYQITWRSGHVETVMAHQVTWPSGGGFDMFGGRRSEQTPRVLIYGEVDGQWQLLLAADAADILSVRRLANDDEVVR